MSDPYAIRLTASGIASDGTTQPAGTIISFVLWDGVSPYTPQDYAGNTGNVQMVPATQGMVAYAPVPVPQQVSATTEVDWIASNGGTLTMPAGTGLANITISGTIAAATILLPPNPIQGPQSLLQVWCSGGGTITACTIKTGAGVTIATVTLPGTLVKRLIYGATGWGIMPN